MIDTRLRTDDVPMHGALHEELRARGYQALTLQHHDSDRIRRKLITRNGRTVGRMTARECWGWLRRWNRKTAAMRKGR